MDISNIIKWKIDGKEVIQVRVNNQIFWKAPIPPVPPTTNYFYVEDISGVDNQLRITKDTDAPTIALEYSTDKQQWQNWDLTTSLPIKPNSRIYLRGDNATFCSPYNFNPFANRIICNSNFNIGGDLTTLVSKSGNVDDISNMNFSFIFEYASTLISAENLVLPSTVLSNGCYQSLFHYCSNMTHSPKELPALKLAPNCYQSMFLQDEKMITVPNINAIELAENCCSNMFQHDKSITKAPVLKSLNLVTGCYSLMFQNCSNLQEIKAYFLTNPDNDKYGTAIYTYEWLGGTNPTGTFFKNKDAKWERNDTSGDNKNNGWTTKLWDVDNDEEFIPPVPPTTTNYFYVEDCSGTDNQLSIRKGHSSFKIVFEYSTDGVDWQRWNTEFMTKITIPANTKVYIRGDNEFLSDTGGYNSKFNCTGNYNIGGDITSLINKNCNLMVIPRDYCFSYLFASSETLINTKELVLPSTTLTKGCYKGLFSDCINLQTSPITLPSLELSIDCYNNMFYGCENLQTTPILPSLNLVTGCYYFMYYNAKNIKEVRAYFLTDITNNEQYTGGWLLNTSSSGTFFKNQDAQWERTDYSGTNNWAIILVDPITGK